MCLATLGHVPSGTAPRLSQPASQMRTRMILPISEGGVWVPAQATDKILGRRPRNRNLSSGYTGGLKRCSWGHANWPLCPPPTALPRASSVTSPGDRRRGPSAQQSESPRGLSSADVQIDLSSLEITAPCASSSAHPCHAPPTGPPPRQALLPARPRPQTLLPAHQPQLPARPRPPGSPGPSGSRTWPPGPQTWEGAKTTQE